MARQRVLHEDVISAARDKGIERFSEVEYAILERSGEISIFEKEDS